MPETKRFTDPLLGDCSYSFFYITNNLYGGYSAKCAKGSISVDYASPKEMVDLARKAGMNVSLAGEAWIEVGRRGFGEQVSPSEAERLIEDLKKKRGF